MQNVSVKIAGMTCGHCVMAVKGALNEVAGVTVKDVQVGEAIIVIGAPASVEQACAAIEESGYKVVDVKQAEGAPGGRPFAIPGASASPGTLHQMVLLELGIAIHKFVEEQGVGELLLGPIAPRISGAYRSV